MNTFKVKAFKQTSNYFEAWIEDPSGIITHVKLPLAEYKFSSKSGYLRKSLHQVIEEYLKSKENTYYVQAVITSDALGSIHQNSFVAKDFQIPVKEKK